MNDSTLSGWVVLRGFSKLILSNEYDIHLA